MANSTTNLRTVSSTQSSKEATINAMVDAASPATFGARDTLGSSGLTWAYLGGTYLSGGALTQVANSDLSLTPSATNYVEFNPADGTISANTTGFTAGRVSLYAVVAGASSVTSYTDYRMSPPVQPRAAISMASDANKTLTVAEARAQILDITSGVSLGSTRNIVLPLNPQVWVVYNGTTGGQSLQFIGASGTGVTVANGKRAVIYSDGTNIVRVTADNP